jgi:hypothetical protein
MERGRGEKKASEGSFSIFNYFCYLCKNNIIMEATKLDKEASDKVSFITFIIPYFASGYKMDIQKAYFYLKEYGGLDYLYQIAIK